ncbi:MAG: MAPEG family protein [Pseudomonadales bacterium]
MTTPLICLLITMFLPLVWANVGGYYRTRLPGGMDNNNPRRQAQQLEGAGARAYAAQQNAWEALALFAPAVIVAHMLGADPGTSAALAMAFVAFRIAHGICYLADWGAPRSLMFMGGLVCTIWLFLLG